MKDFVVSPGNIPEKFRVYGLLEDFTRMPGAVAEAVSGPVADMSRMPAGGRVRFRTDSGVIRVCVSLERPGANCAADVVADGVFCGRITPGDEDETEYSETIPLGSEGISSAGPRQMRDVTVFFPRTSPVRSLTVSLEEKASVETPCPYKIEKPIVFYGSSITMGAVCSSPSRAYTALVAERLGADHINLGFGDNAKGEREMAEYIASLDMSAFVLDYEHNADTVSYLRETHAPFFRIIREAQPELPILLVSRPDVDRELFRSILGRRVIMDTFYEALDAGDRRVDYVDGFYLRGDEDRNRYTVDGCHPNDLGFEQMARVIAPRLRALMERRDAELFGESPAPVKDASGRWVL